MVDFFQSINNISQWLLPLVFQGYDLSGLIRIAAKLKEMVDLLLGKRKSRGLCALCLIDITDLFLFREEQIQGQLLISSAVTTSSALAFRLFICRTHPI